MGNRNSNSASPDYDVAIVGGGVSGIYCGWRLVTAPPGEHRMHGASKLGSLKVAVFEGGDRIGGRLLSARPPGFTNSTVCELGGMRYVSSQRLVRSLIENELQLPHYRQIVDQDENIAYLRGEQLRFSQVMNPCMLPYDLDWAEAQYVMKNDPSKLIGWAIGKFLPGVNTFTGTDLEKYLRTAEVGRTRLCEHGFWNLLARGLSPDAYDLARTLVGYDCLGSNANAVDLIIEYFKFTPDAVFSLLNQGYDTVPWTLQKRFEENGGKVFQKAWVAGFDTAIVEDGEPGVVLNFGDGRPPVRARILILAMPRRSLELLDRTGPVFGAANVPRIQPLLNSVRAIPLYKIFLVYKYSWWNAVGVSKGRSLTDTPVRQLYYWPVDPSASAPSATGNSLLMAYNDATNVDFWAGLTGGETPRQRDQDTKGHLRRLPPPGVRMFDRKHAPKGTPPEDAFSKCLLKNWQDHEAPHEMVKEMHRQIKRMHNIQYAPKPIDAAYMDWSTDPYGGGVHLWNRGADSSDILHKMTQPIGDFPCYICGEAYSTNQTWVEGALQTAEIVLTKHLGLAKPKWVTPS